MSTLTDRLRAYNGNKYNSSTNPRGFDGKGGMDANFVQALTDVANACDLVGTNTDTVATNTASTTASASAAATSATSAAGSASAAATSATNAATSASSASASATAASGSASSASASATAASGSASSASTSATNAATSATSAAGSASAAATSATNAATSATTATNAAATAVASAGNELICSVGGTTTAIVLTSGASLTGVFNGLSVRFLATNLFTGSATTIAVDTAPAKTVWWKGATPPASLVSVGDLVSAVYVQSLDKFVISNLWDGGTLSRALNETSVTLASAATLNIGAAAGNYLIITGTTTVTAFDTAQAGTRRKLKFSGALTLTHNSTSLILPGASNITTAAGDVIEFISEGSGNWRCTNYTPSAGVPLLKSGGTMLNPLVSSAGTSSAPAIAIGETNSGFYWVSANIIALVSNAVEVFRTAATGVISFMKAVRGTLVTLTPSSNVFTVDCNTGNEFDAGTIAANSTFSNVTNPPPSGTVQSITIKTVMNGTGGYTFSFGTNWAGVGNTTINSAAGKTNLILAKVYSSGAVVYSIAKGA